MPARPCQRRAAAWCLLLCLAPFAPGQGDAGSTTNQGRLFRPPTLSSSGSSDQLGAVEIRAAVAGHHAYADQAPVGAASNHSSSQHGSTNGQVVLNNSLLPVKSSQRRRSLMAYRFPRRLLAESGSISPGTMSAPMPAPGILTSPKSCVPYCWSLCLESHPQSDIHASHETDNRCQVDKYAAYQAWQPLAAVKDQNSTSSINDICRHIRRASKLLQIMGGVALTEAFLVCR